MEQKLIFSEYNQDLLSLDIDNSFDIVRNGYGKIRRYFAVRAYNDDIIKINDILGIYKQWVKEDEYICLRGLENHYYMDLDNNKYKLSSTPVYRFVKASKRGNDVYRYLVKQKFKKLDDLPKIEFFRDDFKRKKTKLLFITLTFDITKASALESWVSIPKLFNLFKANLTKNYGRLSIFRVWESTEKYYAHIHCLIYFKDFEFEVFKHINKKRQVTYRIPFYQVSKIKKYYPYLIDIQGCESSNRALNEVKKYVMKYLLKDNVEDKPTKTNAMCWFNNKKGYSISRDFFKDLQVLDVNVDEPKTADLISNMCNSNQEFIKWEYVGLLTADELKINGKIWFLEIKKPPDYVMNVIDLLLSEKEVRLG